jgi:hypothetical protein
MRMSLYQNHSATLGTISWVLVEAEVIFDGLNYSTLYSLTDRHSQLGSGSIEVLIRMVLLLDAADVQQQRLVDLQACFRTE